MLRSRGIDRRLIIIAVLLTVFLGAGALAVSAAPPAQEEAPEAKHTELTETREDNYFCDDPDFEHPVAFALADAFELDYEDVIAMFCDGYGFGQIGLALYTAEATADAPDEGEGIGEADAGDDLLDAVTALLENAQEDGWGEIWQEMGLIGPSAEPGPPADLEIPPVETGPPADLEIPPVETGPPADLEIPPVETGPPTDHDNGAPPIEPGPPADVEPGPPAGVGGGPPGGNG